MSTLRNTPFSKYFTHFKNEPFGGKNTSDFRPTGESENFLDNVSKLSIFEREKPAISKTPHDT